MKIMKLKSITAFLLVAVMTVLSFASCDKVQDTRQPIEEGTQTPDLNPANTAEGVDSSIKLEGSSAVCGAGATYENGKIMITSAGKYTVSGTLDDGQICVEVTKEERVELVFNGVNITCKTSAPIYVKSADKVYINVLAGTENVLTDTANYKFENGTDEPNACIFSCDDLTIKGSGKLTVFGNYKNGISSKNDIKIKEATIDVTAYNNGIRGKDSVEIESGDIKVVSGNDGIKSSNDVETGRGYIQITGGNIYIEAGDDCLQAVTEIIASDCLITAIAQGKVYNCPGNVSIPEGCLKQK